MTQWTPIPGKSTDFWFEVRDPDGWYEAVVKWDGCIHFYQAGNDPFDDENGHSDSERSKEACDDYIHICDIDGHIERLIALKEAALKHFGPTWPR